MAQVHALDRPGTPQRLEGGQCQFVGSQMLAGEGPAAGVGQVRLFEADSAGRLSIVQAHLALTGEVTAEDVAAHGQPLRVQRNFAAVLVAAIEQPRISER